MRLTVINILDLGRVDYATALGLQQAVAHLVQTGRVGHTLLLLEHPPVITLGRNAGAGNIVASREYLAEQGIALFETDRGGDVTFHGPGQLVGYPIFDLRGFTPKIGAVDFVRRMEEALIRTCGDLGVPAQRVPGMTGVWTQNDPPAKIAAIGVHVSRGVTSHGFALNLSTNLEYFNLIVPCGLAGKPVTSLEHELKHNPGATAGQVPSLEQAAEQVSRNFGRVFEAQTLWLDSLDALFASAPAEPANQDTPARAPERIRKLAGEEDFHLA